MLRFSPLLRRPGVCVVERAPSSLRSRYERTEVLDLAKPQVRSASHESRIDAVKKCDNLGVHISLNLREKVRLFVDDAAGVHAKALRNVAYKDRAPRQEVCIFGG